MCIQIGPTFPVSYSQDDIEEVQENQLTNEVDSDWFSSWKIHNEMSQSFQQSFITISNTVDKQKCSLQLFDQKSAFFHALPVSSCKNLLDYIYF